MYVVWCFTLRIKLLRWIYCVDSEYMHVVDALDVSTKKQDWGGIVGRVKQLLDEKNHTTCMYGSKATQAKSGGDQAG
jgi:hypothetical protein